MSISKDFSARAAELYAFCQERGFNTRVALMMDLGRHSGRRRFVVWDFQQGRALHSFPASHGSGSAQSHVRSAYAKCSNEDGSHLSSIGKCLIAERYEGRYGVAYRLDGLEESNSATACNREYTTRKAGFQALLFYLYNHNTTLSSRRNISSTFRIARRDNTGQPQLPTVGKG